MVRTPDFQSGNVEFNSLMGYHLCLVGEVAIISACRAEVKGSEPLQGVYFEHFKIKYKKRRLCVESFARTGARTPLSGQATCLHFH